MIEKQVVVKANFEARNAALFVQTASKFKSKIQVKLQHKMANAKSIMGMISLGIQEGNHITVAADGDDGEQAVSELIRMLTNVNY